MCASAPSAPSIPEPEPLPTPKPLPAPKQAPPPKVQAPAPVMAPVKAAPPPKQADPLPTAPPPTLVQGTEDAPVVKKKKSKRAVNQQRSKGTSALKIPLNTSAKKSAGLNIPTSN